MSALGAEKVNCFIAFRAMFMLLNSHSDSALAKLLHPYCAGRFYSVSIDVHVINVSCIQLY
jgi:hypothetical protein